MTEGGRKLYSARAVKQVLGIKGNVRRAMQIMGLSYSRADFDLKEGVRRMTAIDRTSVAALAEKYCDKSRADVVKRQLGCLEGRIV